MNALVTRNVLLLAGAAVLVAAGAVGLVLRGSDRGLPSSPPGAQEAKTTRYHCPMHPKWVSDQPGDCPICGMRLVSIEEEKAPQAAPPGLTKKVIYQSTMNPQEVSDRPGKDSMGMEMVPVEIDEPPAGEGAQVEGRVTVSVPSAKQQLIGVRTDIVRRERLVRTIRTVGRVTYDETRLHHVHTKVDGWIERLDANATGELVKKGEPLLTIYSPELLASAQEYLLAVRARERLAGATLPEIRASGDDLVESARRRLLLFDITEDQIRDLEATGVAPRTMTLYAPITGHIIVRNVLHGEKIESGSNLLDIADLSRVWVLADVYEYELPFVREGQAAAMTLSYLPGRTFEGRITLVYPFLSEATRTVKVRLEFPNPGFMLKPEMFGEVQLESDSGEGLVVPDSAVISSGTRDIVFVDVGDGYFEPREVELGVRLPEAVQILDGLAEGERVVASGNFLIDSESKLKAALSAAGTGKSRKAGSETTPGHVH